MNYTLEGTIDRFEESQAVIKLENGTTLMWPKDKIPDDAQEGKVIRLQITTNETETKDREQTAKNILNEILQNE